MSNTDNVKVTVRKQYSWLKLHCKVLHDPKIRRLEYKHQCILFYLWILRCQNKIPHNLTEADIAYSLRISPDELAEAREVLVEKGLLTEDWDIPNWSKYQVNVAPRSNERVQKVRERAYRLGISPNVPEKLRRVVFNRDGDACMYCGSNQSLCLDHMVPIDLAKHDPDSLQIYQSEKNLVVSCRACNTRKWMRLPDDDVVDFSFRDPDIEKLFFETKEKIFNKGALKKPLKYNEDVTVTPKSVTVTPVTRVTVTQNDVTVTPTEIEWPGKEKIEKWQKTYPLIDIKERISYIKTLSAKGEINIKNQTPKGIESYVAKALQEEQKKKECKVDDKITDELMKKFERITNKRLGDELLFNIIFNDLSYSQAHTIAKLRGLPFIIRDHITLYKKIVAKAKKSASFNIFSAEKLAKAGGIKQLNPSIRKFVEEMDSRKTSPFWQPEK